ncbi:MAG: hypothetical protein PHW60_05220 [Kiritimatiellae bacterium]|nr:hypothetical protein [Kiritimatiellia bacterium]
MKEMSDIGLERSNRQCGQSISRATLALLCFYVFAGVFNGEALLRGVERMPYGNKRDACVALMKPAAWLSRVTRAGCLRAWLEKTVNLDPPP